MLLAVKEQVFAGIEMNYSSRTFLSVLLLLAFSSFGNRMPVCPGEIIEKEDFTLPQQIAINQVIEPQLAEELNLAVERWHKRLGFHGNVFVSVEGFPLLKKAIGTADFKTKEPLTTESVFQLASVSKQFTAFAIIILKERGLISYDDKMIDHLPELNIPKRYYDRITIRQMLNHTSGLPNYMWLLDHHWKSESMPTNEQVIALMAEKKSPLFFTPGRKFDYSNTGYILLASIVERLTGKNFPEFLENEIFAKTGMKNSYVKHDLTFANKKEVKGFRRSRWRYREIVEDLHDRTYGDKGVYSTLEDLNAWDGALYNASLVSHQSIKEAFTPGKVRWGRATAYGFGFRLKKRNNKQVVYHHGLWNGFRTSFLRYVEDTTTIVVLNHTNSRAKHTLTNKIENVLKKHRLANAGLKVVETALTKDVVSAIRTYDRLIETHSYPSDFPEQLIALKLFLEQENKPISANRIVDLYVHVTGREMPGSANAAMVASLSRDLK